MYGRRVKVLEALLQFREKLKSRIGRHIYAFVGETKALERLERELGMMTTPFGRPMPPPVSLNLAVLSRVPRPRLESLARREEFSAEAIYRELNVAFKDFVAEYFEGNDILLLKDFELLFHYKVELNYVRGVSMDRRHTAFLLPGKRDGPHIRLYSHSDNEGYPFYPDLIPRDNLWEIKV